VRVLRSALLKFNHRHHRSTDSPAEQVTERAGIKTWFETATRVNTSGLGAERISVL
jgi:hypothetical protein